MVETGPVLGVTGRPILHSLSPELFRILFRAADVQGSYVRIASASAEESLRLFDELGLQGMNVTSPFKEEMLPLLAILDAEALELGAVNSVSRDGSLALQGGNTDPAGVLTSLVGAGFPPSGLRCLVIGAGGAGRAAAYALVRAGGFVTVVNRSEERAASLARELGCESAGFGDLARLALGTDIIVSSLSSAALPEPGAWFPGAPGRAGARRCPLVVLDADYRVGLLASCAANRGAIGLSGLHWLVHQGIPAFEGFVGSPVALEPRDIVGELEELRRIGPAGSRGIALIRAPGFPGGEVGALLAASLGLPLLEAERATFDPDARDRPGQPGVSVIDDEVLYEGIKAGALRSDFITVWIHGPGDRAAFAACAAGLDLVVSAEGRSAGEVAGMIHEEIAHRV